MKFDWTRVFGWLAPIACIALAAYLIFGGLGNLQHANRDLLNAQFDEANAATAQDLAARERGLVKFGALPPSQSEEPKFLNGLKTHAAQCEIDISKWTEHAPESVVKPVADAGTPDANQNEPTLKDLLRIRGEITLDGDYLGIRNFLAVLNNSTRLYTISNLKWSRAKHGVELTAVISRYIDPTLSVKDANSALSGRI